MRASRRGIATTAVGMILLGCLCPILCLAAASHAEGHGGGPPAAGHVASHAPDHAAGAAPGTSMPAARTSHCRDASDGAPADPAEAPSPDHGCTHCTTTAAASTADLALDGPSPLATLPPTIAAWSASTGAERATRTSLDPPPPRPLLLLKRSLLL